MNFRKRINLIWTFAQKHLVLFGIAELCILVLYAVSLILPLNLKSLTDDVLSGGKHFLLPQVIVIYLILFLVASVVNVLYGYIWQTLNNRYILNLKTTLYKKIIYAKADFLSGMNSGDCMSRIDNDAEQFLHAIQRNVFHFINSLVLCIAIVVIVTQMNFTIAIMLIIAALLPVIITRLFSIRMEKYAKRCREIEGKLTGKLLEVLKGLREIRLFCAHAWAAQQLSERFQKTIGYKNKMTEADFALQKCVHFINLLTSLIIYGYCAYLISNHMLSVGAFLAITEYIVLLHKKFNWILRICLEWSARKISIDRVNEMISMESEPHKGEKVQEINSVVFDNVSFGYGEKRNLKNLSFTIHKGEKIAIVGENGCGKTTIVDLMTGLYQPTSGTIFVNGTPLEYIKLSSLRSKISVVSQKIALFEGNIKDNLRMFGENPDEGLQKALEIVGLIEKTSKPGYGIETCLEIRADKLSGGQKQRVMIARALVKGTNFLILDEADSALDKKAQEEILNTVMRQTGSTVILITHEASHLKFCDRIIVLNQGETEAIGRHNELLDSSPTYRSLFYLQVCQKVK